MFGSFVRHTNPTLHQYFFCAQVFRQLWVFFHFLTRFMGAFPLNRNRVRIFPCDSQPSKGSNLGFRSGSWIQKSRLAVQSSGIRLARVDLINSGWIRMDTTNCGGLRKYFWERMEMIIIGQGYSALLLCLRLEWLDWIRTCSVWFFGFNSGIAGVSLVSGSKRVRFVGYPA